MPPQAVCWTTVPISSPSSHFERAGEPADVLLRTASEVMTLREMIGYDPDTMPDLYLVLFEQEVADDILRATVERIVCDGPHVHVRLVLLDNGRPAAPVESTDSIWW